MPIREVLVDSSYLYALYDSTDRHHSRAIKFAEAYTGISIIPDVVVSEVVFLLNREAGLPAVAFFLQTIQEGDPYLEPLQVTDLKRIREIMLAYPEAHLDFVDCCLMALAERLDIRHICTFDRRDFSIFRPTHVDYLELLP